MALPGKPDPHYNLTGIPTWVFTPTTGITSTLQVYNEGSSPLYLGQGPVTPYNGMQLLPGSRMRLANITASVYACSGVMPGTAATTTLGSAASAGSTVLTLATAASFTVGATAIIGNTGKGQEVLTVTGTTATALTVSTATLYDHASGVTVSTAVVFPAQIHVEPGVI